MFGAKQALSELPVLGKCLAQIEFSESFPFWPNVWRKILAQCAFRNTKIVQVGPSLQNTASVHAPPLNCSNLTLGDYKYDHILVGDTYTQTSDLTNEKAFQLSTWLEPNKLRENRLEEKLRENSSPPKLHGSLHQQVEEWRKPTVTALVRLRFGKFVATRRARNFWSANSPSNDLFVKSPRTSKPTSASKPLPSWPCKKQLKLTWLDFLKTRTCAPSTQSEWRSCQKTCSWLAESEENVPKCVGTALPTTTSPLEGQTGVCQHHHWNVWRKASSQCALQGLWFLQVRPSFWSVFTTLFTDLRTTQAKTRTCRKQLDAAEDARKRSTSTFTRCWSKCTPKLACRRRPWASSTRSWATPSRRWQLKLEGCASTERSKPCQLETSSLPASLSFQENLQNTQWAKAARQWRSTPATVKLPSSGRNLTYHYQALSRVKQVFVNTTIETFGAKQALSELSEKRAEYKTM